MADPKCQRCGTSVNPSEALCYQCALRWVKGVLYEPKGDVVSISVTTVAPREKEVCPKCGNCEWRSAYWFFEKVLTCVRCNWIQGD